MGADSDEFTRKTQESLIAAETSLAAADARAKEAETKVGEIEGAFIFVCTREDERDEMR